MPPVSAVATLPGEVRDELNSRLVSSGFSDYRGLSDWLAVRGYQIGRTALNKYGQKMQEQFESAMADARRTTELAKAMVDASPDDSAALMEANQRIAADSLLRIQLALREAEKADGADPREFALIVPKITRAAADLSRSGVVVQKYRQELAARLAAAADEAAPIASKAGLSDADWSEIRAKFLGVAGG